MKTPFKLLASAGAAALVLTSTGLQAESTYGYNPAGAAGATATARVNINVTVPTLILLRVGSNAAVVDTVTLALQPNPGIPGPLGAASPLTAGSSQASGWDGTAPIMSATATPATLTAIAWTNSAGGGNVNGAVTTPFAAASGLTAANILVTSGGGGSLAHPGADTGTFAATPFARNTVVSSTWAYSMNPAGLAAAAAGSHTQVVTYTATAL